MKRACISYYTRPRNRFSRKLYSLEQIENYQDFMIGYDPVKDSENLKDHEQEQLAYNQIEKVLPLLNSKRRRLVELCLKYGFQYKVIAELMGTSISETSKEVKMAIHDIKTIIQQGSSFNAQKKSETEIRVPSKISQEQAKVLKLRCEEKHSFANIALALNLSEKEVHQTFVSAYKLMQGQAHLKQQ